MIQQYDEIIDCPKSGGDLCYKIEANPEITNYFSLSCGFWTNSLMKAGTDFYKEQWDLLPELYKDIAWIDPKTELIWLPNTINIPELGMVFAEGTNPEDWRWAATKAVELSEEDQKKHGVQYKADMKTIAHFPERQYMDALSYIGVLPE